MCTLALNENSGAVMTKMEPNAPATRQSTGTEDLRAEPGRMRDACDIRIDAASIFAGFRTAALPIGFSVFAYGLVFGLLARQVGLSSLEAVLMSVTVFAGAAQLVVMDIWREPVLPVATAVVLTTLIVNLRHVLMGLALGPWFSRLPRWQSYGAVFFMNDESWAMTMRELTRGGWGPGYLIGAGSVVLLAWASATAIGGSLGMAISDPAVWGLDFAFTAVFVSLLTGMWRGRADIVPWVTAALVALAGAQWLPGKWYILLGGIAGGVVGGLLAGTARADATPVAEGKGDGR